MHHESPTISSLALLHRAAENPHCPVSSSNYLRRDGAFSGLEIVMVKDRCGAERLADMIARKINVPGVEAAVRRDHGYGWVPTVVSAPSVSIGLQRRADEIAHILRTRFELV